MSVPPVRHRCWGRKANWTFGTGPGNTMVAPDGNQFMPFADHAAIAAIWNGGSIASGQGNSSISSPLMRYAARAPARRRPLRSDLQGTFGVELLVNLALGTHNPIRSTRFTPLISAASAIAGPATNSA